MISMRLNEAHASHQMATPAFENVYRLGYLPPLAGRPLISRLPQPEMSKSIETVPSDFSRSMPRQAKFIERLAVRVDDKVILVRLADVLWIQSCGNNLRLYVFDTGYDCRMTMKDLQVRLDPNFFLRVHRNAIVNLDYVTDFELPRGGNAFVHLRNGKALPISRTGRMTLRQTLLSRNFVETTTL